MPTAESLTVTAHLTLIQTVDGQRPASDRAKLPGWLREQLDTDLQALDQSDGVLSTSEVDRSQKSVVVARELARMEELVRDGYKGIAAIRASVIGEAERAAVFASYGWTGGLLGRLGDDRIVALARIGCRNHEEIAPDFRYAPALVADLTLALETYDLSVPAAIRPAAGSPTRRRNETLKAAGETLSQIRHWYCATSRDTVSSQELLRVGFQPRRKPRSKEAIESATKRNEEKRLERERKRLERIEEETQRDLRRLALETERLRAKADQARGELTALGGAANPTGDGADRTVRDTLQAESASNGDVPLPA